MTGHAAARRAALAALAPLLLAGCGEDFLNPGGDTVLQGRIVIDPSVDPGETPIGGLGVGVVYGVQTAGPGSFPVLGSAQAGGVTLRPPYPNPFLETGAVRLDVAAATTARVEVWSEGPPFPAVAAVLHNGALSAGTRTFTWDGTELGSRFRVPNGLYTVRVTVPAQPPAGTTSEMIEAAWIVNQPLIYVIARNAFNEWTDGDGYYQIGSLAVGEPFVRTDASGAVLGSGVLANRVTLFTDDRDFGRFERLVSIAPRNIVTVDIALIPLVPPLPGGPPAAVAAAERP